MSFLPTRRDGPSSLSARVSAGAIVVLTLSGSAALGQTVVPGSDDTKVAVVYQPANPASKHLSTHPGAIALPSAKGRLQFRNSDGTKSTILGPVTRRDPQSGDWVPLAPVLSTTRNGWRIDGAWNDVFIRKQGN